MIGHMPWLFQKLTDFFFLIAFCPWTMGVLKLNLLGRGTSQESPKSYYKFTRKTQKLPCLDNCLILFTYTLLHIFTFIDPTTHTMYIGIDMCSRINNCK